ncbi:hypothetical protein ACJRO7_023382 [Eucalyptus globulus]|uniref:Uncharacterized protein n=1 Tax=Eucalyptus globulus TaxID=34317 RepID=A0ABD3KB19_EUCGL
MDRMRVAATAPVSGPSSHKFAQIHHAPELISHILVGTLHASELDSHKLTEQKNIRAPSSSPDVGALEKMQVTNRRSSFYICRMWFGGKTRQRD